MRRRRRWRRREWGKASRKTGGLALQHHDIHKSIPTFPLLLIPSHCFLRSHTNSPGYFTWGKSEFSAYASSQRPQEKRKKENGDEKKKNKVQKKTGTETERGEEKKRKKKRLGWRTGGRGKWLDAQSQIRRLEPPLRERDTQTCPRSNSFHGLSTPPDPKGESHIFPPCSTKPSAAKPSAAKSMPLNQSRHRRRINKDTGTKRKKRERKKGKKRKTPTPGRCRAEGESDTKTPVLEAWVLGPVLRPVPVPKPIPRPSCRTLH